MSLTVPYCTCVLLFVGSSVSVEDLVAVHLQTHNKALTLLLEDDLAQALENFVDKRNFTSVADLVNETLDRTQVGGGRR